MTNRSSHIPMTTEMEATTVPATVRVRARESKATGTRKQVTTMVQKNGAKRH